MRFSKLSRSYNQKRKRRIVKNAFIQKITKLYGSDLYCRNNKKYLNRIVRARLKAKMIKENR